MGIDKATHQLRHTMRDRFCATQMHLSQSRVPWVVGVGKMWGTLMTRGYGLEHLRVLLEKVVFVVDSPIE